MGASVSEKKSGGTGRFCEVAAPQRGLEPRREAATVKIEIGNVYVEVRDADTTRVQEYLLDVLARSC